MAKLQEDELYKEELVSKQSALFICLHIYSKRSIRMKKVDRVEVICEMFSHAYFSFLPVSHVVWRQTEDMISLYWDSLDTQVDRDSRMEEMQDRMLGRSSSIQPTDSQFQGSKQSCSPQYNIMWSICRISQVLCCTLDIGISRKAGIA